MIMAKKNYELKIFLIEKLNRKWKTGKGYWNFNLFSSTFVFSFCHFDSLWEQYYSRKSLRTSIWGFLKKFSTFLFLFTSKCRKYILSKHKYPRVFLWVKYLGLKILNINCKIFLNKNIWIFRLYSSNFPLLQSTIVKCQYCYISLGRTQNKLSYVRNNRLL